jgi:uncharacterized phage-like protein YoqJ
MATACFTGHRKLGAVYYNRHNPSTEWHTLKQYMDQVVRQMHEMPYYVDHFISGLAIGVDMLGAESVNDVRMLGNLNTPIKLTGAMPFPSQPNKWPEHTRQHWQEICAMCDQVVAVSQDPYHPSKMQIRNQWMVDSSDYVIAVWNGIKYGGTWNCMSYALKQNKPVLAVQPLGLQWSCGWLTGEPS